MRNKEEIKIILEIIRGHKCRYIDYILDGKEEEALKKREIIVSWWDWLRYRWSKEKNYNKFIEKRRKIKL